MRSHIACLSRAALLVSLMLAVISPGVFGQTPINHDDVPDVRDLPDPAEASVPGAPGTQKNKGVSRWFELQLAQLSVRYRYIDNSAGETTLNQMQHRESFKARFKLDAEGRYSFNLGVFSGRAFTAAWANTGAGTGQAQSNLSIKQFYFSAAPRKWLEIQYGGLYILRGDSTEITTYDDDGYIVGERVNIKHPAKLYFDEITVTFGFLDDIATPNLNKRFHRLRQSNYHQFLFEKKLGKRSAFSVDYTFDSGVETLREAIRIDTLKAKIIDSIRFENYQRLDVNRAAGFALYGEKALGKHFTLSGGYADIDSRYGNLNADRFSPGRRVFLNTSVQLTPEFSILTFTSLGLRASLPTPQRHRFDLIMNFNLLKGLQRAGLL